MYMMVQHYNYTLNDLDNMIPFERDIYISMINRDNKQKMEEQEKLR